MAGFDRMKTWADAVEAGKVQTSSFRKVPSQASVAGGWVDLSMTAGNPPPNYYIGTELAATTLNGMRGIFHGADAAPARKFIRNWSLCTPTAGLVGEYRLLDYLLFYPFVDLDTTDEQVMDNTVTLPRYTTGDGVLAMLVAVTPTVGGGSFTFNYIDQTGAAKTSPTISCSVAAVNIASIVTGEQGTAAGGRLFLPLATGSTGIRSVTSLTMVTPAGGLGALVLVRPLAEFAVREANMPAEIEYWSLRSNPPQVLDGAYLNLVMNCAATVAAGTLTGFSNIVLGE